MSCRLSELVLKCRDPEMLSRFWCEVLGYVELGREGADIEIGPESGFGGRRTGHRVRTRDGREDQPDAASPRREPGGPRPGRRAGTPPGTGSPSGRRGLDG